MFLRKGRTFFRSSRYCKLQLRPLIELLKLINRIELNPNEFKAAACSASSANYKSAIRLPSVTQVYRLER